MKHAAPALGWQAPTGERAMLVGLCLGALCAIVAALREAQRRKKDRE